jgi:hypothetical protein
LTATTFFVCTFLSTYAVAQVKEEPPVQLSLISSPDDPPELAKLKAAFRLFSVYTQVEGICNKCRLEKTMVGYARSNGKILSQSLEVIKKAEALTPEWKQAVEDFSQQGIEEAMANSTCQNLDFEITKGQWALHRGRSEDDYKIMRGQQP